VFALNDLISKTAERSVNSLNASLKVDFLGNAPVAVYKLKIDENTIEKVNSKEILN
jgi:hypothetical protein